MGFLNKGREGEGPFRVDPEDLHFEQVDFNRYAGFSDHTIGINAAIVAISRGARILEKHFTLSKKLYGPDHAISAEPAELRQQYQGEALGAWLEETGESLEDFQARDWDDNEGIFVVKQGQQ